MNHIFSKPKIDTGNVNFTAVYFDFFSNIFFWFIKKTNNDFYFIAKCEYKDTFPNSSANSITFWTIHNLKFKFYKLNNQNSYNTISTYTFYASPLSMTRTSDPTKNRRFIYVWKYNVGSYSYLRIARTSVVNTKIYGVPPKYKLI